MQDSSKQTNLTQEDATQPQEDISILPEATKGMPSQAQQEGNTKGNDTESVQMHDIQADSQISPESKGEKEVANIYDYRKENAKINHAKQQDSQLDLQPKDTRQGEQNRTPNLMANNQTNQANESNQESDFNQANKSNQANESNQENKEGEAILQAQPKESESNREALDSNIQADSKNQRSEASKEGKSTENNAIPKEIIEEVIAEATPEITADLAIQNQETTQDFQQEIKERIDTTRNATQDCIDKDFTQVFEQIEDIPNAIENASHGQIEENNTQQDENQQFALKQGLTKKLKQPREPHISKTQIKEDKSAQANQAQDTLDVHDLQDPLLFDSQESPSKPQRSSHRFDYILYSKRLFICIALVASFVGLYAGYLFFGSTSFEVLWSLHHTKNTLYAEVEQGRLDNASLQRKVLELKALEPK